ncbi:PPIC-type PPIASE domain protein [uncultured delta proteobacterium]|uniref:PPIC-type PPIASE domain protein n=1 Tax=uncultured delta proteobacterium TaxID=34034 RepID=A0A212J1N7_9DELT|nr:PPIC-type PPIASE domain protein [uncultured delta proteobacterium]
MKTIRCCVAALVFLAMPCIAFAASNELPQPVVLNKIAAVVNGEIITLHDLRRHAAAEFVRAGINASDPANRAQIDRIMSRVLSVMIEDILLRQEAERLQIKASDSDVDNEVRKLAQRNQMNMKDFEARVVAQGGTMEMLRERVRNTILSQRIVNIQIARKTVVTAEEVKKYFDAHQNEFAAERSVDVSLIVFAPSADPLDVYKKITAKTLSFEDAAKKFSEGPSPENGGRLGMIKWDDLAAPFKAQVVQLKDGEISEVFHANTRDCLIKLNGSTSGRTMTLEEATPEIERILREPRLQERFTEYTDQLRSRAVIDIRL